MRNNWHRFTLPALAVFFMSGVTTAQQDPAMAPDPNAPQEVEPPDRPRRPQRPDAPQQPRRPRAGQVQVPDSIQLVRDVVYAEVHGKDGNTIELKLDAAFLKQSDGKPMPAVVYIHGGGWSSGSRDTGLPLSVAFAGGGYFAATIDYRLAGEATYPAAVHDCKAAIRFLRTNAEELGIDPNRIGVWGHSAGGHLSALLGTTGNTDVLDGSVGQVGTSSSVEAVVAMSGISDLNKLAGDREGGMIAQWLGGAKDDMHNKATEASPVTYVDSADPPVMIIHGTDDRLVPLEQAELFRDSLKKAGVDVQYMAIEGEGHGIRNREAYMAVAEFFDTQLGGNAMDAIREAVAQFGSFDSPQTDRPQRQRRPRQDRDAVSDPANSPPPAPPDRPDRD